MSVLVPFIEELLAVGVPRERICAELDKLDITQVPFCESASLLLSYDVPIESAMELLRQLEADRKRYLNIAVNWKPPKKYARQERTKKYGPAQDPDGYWTSEKLRAYAFGASWQDCWPEPRLSEADWWPLVGEVFRRDNYTCTYCGADGDEYVLHCDHIVPISRGGPNVIENLTTACDYCNCSKRNALPHEWRPARGVPA
jgi:hypothetical protein